MNSRFCETHGQFDEIYRRLERLDQEYQAIEEGLRSIEALRPRRPGDVSSSNADWKTSGNRWRASS